ncbi:MAG: PAS domain-containing protein [Anaerolineaceae bacterium]|nr:PAS domain-containing protein [Anaerolineaceae bacterium]
MSQPAAIHSQDSTALLHKVLRIVAANPKSEQSAFQLLQLIQQLTGAAGACLSLFDDPDTHVVVGESEEWVGRRSVLRDLAQILPPGVHVNQALPPGLRVQYAGWLVAPLQVDGGTQGVVWLSFPAPPELAESVMTAVKATLDGLTIVAANLLLEGQRENADQLSMSLLMSIPDPFLVLDDEKRVVLLNPAAEAAFGVVMTEAKGRPLSAVIQAAELVALVEEAQQGLSEWTNEAGSTFAPRVTAVRNPDGEIEGWILALRDITRFKRLNRNQSEFMRIVSHDLRSPLTAMQGFASMLEMVGELNEKQDHFVEKILSGITQMTALVDNIQDAGRYDPETGFYELSRSHCDLAEMVNRIVDNHLVPAEKQELTIKSTAAGDVPIINVDYNMLERAITNLVDNAIKYTPNGGMIEVGVSRKEDNVIVSVQDSGLGISLENQKRLFERHVRLARQEHKRIKGSGLGLFIVRSVAQRHGGDAWVESEDGKGSCFFLSIPLVGANLVGSHE